MFKRIRYKWTSSLNNRANKIYCEYVKVSNDVAFKFYIFNFFLLTIACIIVSISSFIAKNIINGSVLLAMGIVFVCIICFRNRCKKVIPVLSFILALSMLGWGLYAAGTLLKLLNAKALFYLGYSFALFHSILVQVFPRRNFQLCYAACSMIIRYTVILPDSFESVVATLILDVAMIFMIFHNEKNHRTLFKSFYEYREEFTKFKVLLSSHLLENIVIFNKDLDKKYFINESFTNNFGAQTPEEIFNVFSNFRISATSLECSFSHVNLLPPTPSVSPTPSHSHLYPVSPQAAQSLKDFLLVYKENLSNDQNIAAFNVQYEAGDCRFIYNAKVFNINWDNSEAIVIMLNDLTQQETILALKMADENKDKVLATVSHELRTPINGMLGVTQIIENEYQDPKLLSYIKTAKICSSLLLNLVNSILDLTQIRKNCIKLNPTKFKLNDMLEEVKVIFKTQCSLKKLGFDVNLNEDVPEEILTDRERLTQVIINLLSNALKFTFKGGIRLIVTLGQLRDEISFAIEDTGIGIKTEDQSKLFKMFGRLDTVSSRFNTRGVGLGLTISNSLVGVLNPSKKDAHIDFTSKYGQGTVFSFSVPTKLAITINRVGSFEEEDGSLRLEKDSQNIFEQNDSILCNRSVEERACPEGNLTDRLERYVQVNSILNTKRLSKSTAPPPQIRKSMVSLDSATERYALISDSRHQLSVKGGHSDEIGGYMVKGAPALVVDDNAFNIMIVTSLLVKNGFTVISAFNGEDAIEKAKEQSKTNFFKIVFMDCQMPVMDGFEAAEKLRDMMLKGEIPETPILALTANNTKQDQEKCLKSGMVGHLTKPLKESDLKKLINDFVKS